MKKRLQVLMLAALPIFGAFGLYALKEYQLPENTFRRNTQGVEAIEITTSPAAMDPAHCTITLKGSDAVRFLSDFHLERHSGNLAMKTQSTAWMATPNRRDALEVDRFFYSPGFGWASNEGWWREGYELTPSSKRALNAILAKHNRRLR